MSKKKKKTLIAVLTSSLLRITKALFSGVLFPHERDKKETGVKMTQSKSISVGAFVAELGEK